MTFLAFTFDTACSKAIRLDTQCESISSPSINVIPFLRLGGVVNRLLVDYGDDNFILANIYIRGGTERQSMRTLVL